MNKEQLDRGNKIQEEIRQLEKLQSCIFVDYGEEGGIISLNPVLCIEHDDDIDSRYVHRLPGVLSGNIISALAKQADERIEELKTEFENL